MNPEQTNSTTIEEEIINDAYCPEFVGRWRVCDFFSIVVEKRPNWFQRLMIKLCFGWVWEDKDEANT